MWRHIRAIGLLPVTVTVVVPGLLVWRTEAEIAGWPLAAAGALLIALGVMLVTWTVTLFARLGKGTLAPWDATSRLVVPAPTATCETR